MTQRTNKHEALPHDRGSLDAMTAATGAELGAIVLASAAAALNRQDDVAAALRYGFTHGVAPQHFYELLLQLYLFAGFPAALEALSTLRAVADSENIDIAIPAAEPYNAPLFSERGITLCRAVYTTAYDIMRERLGRISPDLDLWMITEGYGKTLSRPDVDSSTRELAIVAVLAVLGWQRQLHSHIRGAVNVGASRAACESVLHLVDKAFGTAPQARAFETLERVFA